MLTIFLLLIIALLSGYSIWHGYHLKKLDRHLEQKRTPQAPYPSGVWGDVYKYIVRLDKRGRKHKNRLSRFNKRFAESASAFPDAVIILGRDDRIEWCNPASGTLLGLSWPEVQDENFSVSIGDPVVTEYLERQQFEKSLELPSPVLPAKIISLGVTRFGKKRQKLVVVRDITASYNLNRIRRDFIANASHELRTPLTVIRGFLEDMDQPDIGREQWLRSMELMRRHAKRMEQTIDDLMNLSRLEMETEKPAFTKVAIPDLLTAIVDEARLLSGEKQHQLTVQIDEHLWLLGVEGELYSAFSNLIFNAIRHTAPRTKVHIHWFAHDDGAVFSVKDEGEGIAARHIPRLSERFYRVDPGRSRDSGGTGLGLAIVKHALERHDGELNIDSAVGYGSTFSCHFPATRTIRK